MRPRGTKRVFRFTSRTAGEIHGDIADEMAFHLEMRVETLRREGFSEAEARAQASREFGDRVGPRRRMRANRPDRRATEPMASPRRRMRAGPARGPAPAVAQSGIRRGRDLHARPEHRRQHRDLQPARCGAPSPGAAARARAPGADLGDTPGRRHQQRLGRRVPRLAYTPDAVRRPRADEPGGSEPERPRSDRAAHRHGGVARVPAGARRAGRDRPRLPAGGGPARRTHRRRDDHRGLLAYPSRRRHAASSASASCWTTCRAR